MCGSLRQQPPLTNSLVMDNGGGYAFLLLFFSFFERVSYLIFLFLSSFSLYSFYFFLFFDTALETGPAR